MKFLTLTALLSSASATIFLQIGTQADSTSVYDAIDTVGNLSIIPRDLVDMRAIDGAVKISSFSLNMESRSTRYYDLEEDGRYSSSIQKPADAGSVFFMSHLMSGDLIPLLTVIDVKPQDFTIYTLRNLTVDSADLNIWDARWYGDSVASTGYIRFLFDSVEVVDGSPDHVGKSHTFTKPVRDSRHKKHQPVPTRNYYKDLDLLGGVQETMIDDEEVLIDDQLVY